MLNKGDYICVFCASKVPEDPELGHAAEDLGRLIAENGYNLVYGGGGRGLMGLVAKGAYQAGSHVLGVIPEALSTEESSVSEDSFVGGKGSISTIMVKDMHSRKRIMADKCSAFVSLPGGYGTFEELLEITTWSILGIHNKPIVILNFNGFYDPLVKLFENSVQSGFISDGNMKIASFCDSVGDVLASIDSYVAPETRFNLDWSTS
ncbi:LOG family protein [Smittium mucronatum]|uniref:LOG family protein n=1 Tax=Smittium mucronatum TaxID=133383 RepID=A0A1R0GQD2_9FUNG|nr:LOG family protein [Smittium mucronatum]OLY79084.1 LOG family protein [Smittium mucronatum]